MEQLRKIGELGRQHYEKLILVFALLVLAIAVFVLFRQSQAETQKVRQESEIITSRAVQGIPAEDLSRHVALMNQITNPPPLNLSGEHNLFSPVRWQTNVFDGKFVRVRSGKDVGPDRLEVVSISPLELIVAWERAAGSGVYLSITNRVYEPRYQRSSQYLRLNETNSRSPVIVREIMGAPDNVTGAMIEFRKTGDRAEIDANKYAARVLDYEAELKYPLEDKTFTKVRAGSTIRFAGEDYKVVDITQNEVVITAPNGRQYRRESNTVQGKLEP